MDHWFYCLRSSWHSVKHSEETWQEVPVSMDTGWRWLRDWRGRELVKRSWVSRGPGSSAPLIEVLLHVGSNVLDGQHGLLARGFDLRLGQQEAITTSVTQFKGVGILHSQVIGPVIRTTSSWVWGHTKERGVILGWGCLFLATVLPFLKWFYYKCSMQKRRQMKLQSWLNLQIVVAPGPLV